MVEINKVLTSGLFLAIFISALAIFIAFAYAFFEPRAEDRFLTLSTLGANMTADNYYLGGNSTLKAGDSVTWYVSVANNMGSSEYVSVRLKLSNSTGDNQTSTSPLSEDNYIYEMRQLVPDNSTWVMPLHWSITDIDKNKGVITIKSISINGQEVRALDIQTLQGGRFRIFIELWRYDAEKNDFTFTWPSATGEERSSWNQLWVKIQ